MSLTLLTELVLFGDNAPPAGGDGGSGSFLIQILPFVIIGFLFYLILLRPQRQEQSRRQTMLDAVKKNDRVITASGIYGVVTNVHREADEVTIKVDEATNTKLRVTLSSIGRVLSGDESSDEPSSPSK